MLTTFRRGISSALIVLFRRYLPASLFLLLLGGTMAHAQGGIGLVQHTSKDAGTTTSSSLAFKSSNAAGNWIAVAIRAGRSNQVFTVTDSGLNVYHKAVQFNVTVDAPNGDTLAIFYAENIAGGANSVTVSDTISGSLRFAILEYSGVATANSLDVTAAAQGTSAAPSSASATTTANGDLLLGAIMSADPETFTAGSGYTAEERVPAAPSTKLFAEDQIQPVAGAVSAGASLGASDPWGAILATFRAAGSGGVGTPSITSLNPTSGAVTTPVTITGTNFGSVQGTSTVTFNGTAGSPTAWSATSITAPVPTGATTGNVVVTVNSVPSNGVSFTVTPPPSITTLTPTFGPVATSVTIMGANFGASQGSSTVTFNGTAATPTSWNATTIVVPVPTGATTGNVVVTVNGVPSNGISFTVPPAQGGIGLVQHTSKDAGTTTSSSLAFKSSNAAGNWIAVAIRAGRSNQVFTVTDSGLNVYHKAVQFNVTVDAPNGDTLAIFYAENIAGGANSVTVSDTISGSLRFAILEYSGVATANSLDVTAAAQGTSAAPSSASATTTANGDLLLGAIMSADPETFTAGSGYTAEERVPAAPSTKLFAEDQIQPVAGAVSAGASLGASDPWGAILATFRAAGSGGVGTPSITSLNPTSGAVTTPVTITGTNFGSVQGTSTVTFNGTVATPTSWNATTIVVPVPIGATTGNVVVTVSGVPPSNGMNFNVTPSPSITSLSPTSGAVTTSVTIAGANFGSVQGTSTVTFNGTAGSPTSWSATSITVPVPTNATTGNVVVTVNGVPSNGVGFSVCSVVSISPRVAALTFTQTQQFTSCGGNVIWRVDGVAGGSASSGTITSTGLYSPPSSLGSHTVTVTSSDQSQVQSATVYISNYPGTFTHHNDNSRTGQNLNETVLTPANVNSAQFGKLVSYTTDGASHASPLYVANVNIPGKGFHNVVYAETEHDTAYAFDADGVTRAPLWQVSFINPAAGITTVPVSDTGYCCNSQEIGVRGTPVIDQATGTLYLVAKTKEVSGTTTNYVQRLHALDIATGAEKFGGPVVIQASVPGIGSGSSGGQLAFDPLRANQRAALLLSNGVVYIGYAAHSEVDRYHGWVLGYDATTLQQVMAFNTTPNNVGGGIWESGGGPATDSAGNLYFSTGNGFFDANTGGVDYGDTVLKLSPSGTVLDYFTPHDQASMSGADADLASGGVLVLPDQAGASPRLVGTAGKTGTVYLVNRDGMGHFNAGNDNQIVQSLPSIFTKGGVNTDNYLSTPVYFNGFVYFSPVADSVQAFQLTNGLLSTKPTSASPETYTDPGGTLSISANGSANAIVWALQMNSTGPAVLRAYDATNLSTELYASSQVGSRDSLDAGSEFNTPTVANGKVFVGTSGHLTIFGLLP